MATKNPLRAGGIPEGEAGSDSLANDPLGLFGQFIGQWRFFTLIFGTGRNALRARGSWTFVPILGGKVIQDTCMVLTPHRLPLSGAQPYYGTTLRIPRQGSTAWTIVWMDPNFDQVLTFHAQRDGDRIIQSGHCPGGHPLRWTFSCITGTSFFWASEVQKIGAEWTTSQKLWCRRQVSQ